jgi:hypothetical protein
MNVLLGDREVAEISEMYTQVEWVLDTLFFVYHAQNSAIGRFAQEKGIAHRPLAEIEEQWISDPDGEDRFFSEFRERNPRDYAEIKSHFDFNVFMLFQMLLRCDPAHLYLLSLQLNRWLSASDLCPSGDGEDNPEMAAFRRLRFRLRPFFEETIQ